MSCAISFRFAVASVTAVLLTGGYCLSQTGAEDVATRIDKYLSARVATDQFSGSVLVADEGKILISKGYGMANIEHSAPIGRRPSFVSARSRSNLRLWPS